MNENVSRRFSPRRDKLLICLLLLGPLLMLIISLFFFFSGKIPDGTILVFIGLALLLLMLFILKATCYTLKRDKLQVNCGPFGYSIRLQDITEVTPGKGLYKLHSLWQFKFALSQQVIHISHHSRWFSELIITTTISPAEQEEFLEELLQRMKECAPQ